MKLRELLSDPSAWTQGEIAKDDEGEPCWPRDDRAASWCLVGAFNKCCFDMGKNEKESVLSRIISAFNDHPSTNHKLILEILERADV